MMMARFARRMIAEIDPRLLARFAVAFGWKGNRAVRRFKRAQNRDDLFPPFLFISLTNRCNLDCTGCWVSGETAATKELPLDAVQTLIRDAKARGNAIFGLLGGEPLLYDGLFELIQQHRDCYFLLFTNGTLLTDEHAARMRRLGNVSPLISIEGDESESDERRGGKDVFRRSLRGVRHCRRHRLVTGVATSLCRSNIESLATEEFLQRCVTEGVHYLWYYIYRPVGPRPAPELTLSADQIVRLREFLVQSRLKTPLMIVDAYWDADGRALCPAATGISHHVGPGGDLEPCPPIQFARDNVLHNDGLAGGFDTTGFLRRFRHLAHATTPGCILLENPQRLIDFIRQEGALDSSGRGMAGAELAAMQACAGHHQPGREIPERHWFYRWGKKNWFCGLGVYG